MELLALLVFILLIGLIIKLSLTNRKFRNPFYDGRIVITEKADGKKLFSLELNGDPNDIVEGSIIRFKVVTAESLLEE